jgi:hypothetical protein
VEAEAEAKAKDNKQQAIKERSVKIRLICVIRVPSP